MFFPISKKPSNMAMQNASRIPRYEEYFNPDPLFLAPSVTRWTRNDPKEEEKGERHTNVTRMAVAGKS